MKAVQHMLHHTSFRPASRTAICTQPSQSSFIAAPLLLLLILTLLSSQLHAQTTSAPTSGAATVPSAESPQSGTAEPAKADATLPTSPAAAEPAPAPPPMPGMAGPLTLANARTFDAGPFGKLDISGVLSGFAMWQEHPYPTDQAWRADISNGQIFIQKPTGLVQFFLQAGAYNFPALGSPVLSTRSTVSDYFGALPQAFLKLAPKGNFSFLIGKLPTLIGAEYTFSFENMNIERGLLWNQENAVTRGVQMNYAKGKLSSSLSWNDGFYSNHYNWLTGALTYTHSSANSIEFIAGGNLGHTATSTIATPLYQNNSEIYDLIYTHTSKRWLIEPYFQYTRVPLDLQIGVGHSTSTQSEAVLGTYTFAPGLSVAGRAEYISSTGSLADKSVSLLYGPGSQAMSLTVTPTYQKNSFFLRAEISYTRALNSTPGDAFGAHQMNSTQIRPAVEAGFIF